MADSDYSDDQHKTPTKSFVGASSRSLKLNPCIVVLAGPRLGEIFLVPQNSQEGMLIGRSEDCALCLSDSPGVSRLHCRIVAVEGGAELVDLGSPNGTWVNGARINQRVRLESGQKIRLGQSTVLRFAMWDAVEELAQRQLLDAALRDSMTRLFNRRYFMQRLSAELRFAIRHRQDLSLLIVDIDHFKSVNDRFGHLRGDSVLRQAATLLTNQLRTEDVIARYGGEEFAVLLRATPFERALEVAERIRRAAETMVCGEGLRITVSVGVSRFSGANPDDSDDPAAALVQLADGALYRAKNGGRNRVEG
jgi:diguanylate cyclase (GGDEF)-like protein